MQWSQESIAWAQAQHEAGWSWQEIATSLGSTPEATRTACRDFRLGKRALSQPRPPLQPPPSSPSVAPPPDDVRRLVDACKRGPVSLERLCDLLGLPPGKVRCLAEKARQGGFTVDIAGDSISWRTPEQVDAPTVPRVSLRPTTGGRFLLGACSDLHFGSKYCMREQLADYIEAIHKLGVRTVLVAGDMLDGCYRHGMWELSHHGWDEQAEDAFQSLPKAPGLEYHCIDGNHDETFWGQTGAVSGARLEDYFRQRGRTDLHYLGAREGNVLLNLRGVRRPVRAQLWHPKPGKAYALSYQVQKRIEAYAPGTKPDLLVCGHWHTAVYLETRGVHALAAGCFQSPESSFARSLSGGVSCGGWMLALEATETGTLRRVAAERWAYYHREDARSLDVEPAA